MKKFKAGIFNREFMKEPMFEALSKTELSTWQLLKSVVKNFLWNHRSVEYEKETE